MQLYIFTGRLGQDPEMKTLASGKEVTNFSVAINEKWNDSNGELQERTLWIRVAAWGRLAVNCNKFLSKGRQVLVTGRLNAEDNGGPRVWEDRDGNPRASFEVTAQTVEFLGSKGDSPGIPDEPPAEEEDEIPF